MGGPRPNPGTWGGRIIAGERSFPGRGAKQIGLADWFGNGSAMGAALAAGMQWNAEAKLRSTRRTARR